MKKSLLWVVLLLTGCGGSSDDFPRLMTFDSSPYVEASVGLSDDSLEGLWVGVIDTQRERYDMVNAEVPSYDASSELKVLLIREDQATLGNFEVASCSGGFEGLSVVGSEVSSSELSGSKSGKNTITYVERSSSTIPLGGFASYKEDVDIKGRFYRVSNSTKGFGSLIYNWSDVEGESSQQITCAYVKRLLDGKRVVRAAAENASIVHIANYIAYPERNALISEQGHEGTIYNSLSFGYQELEVLKMEPFSVVVDYYVESLDGLAVVGKVEWMDLTSSQSSD